MLKKIITTLFIVQAVFFLLNSACTHAATIQLPRTGQTKCYDTAGTEIACATTGQDGDKLKGAAWPTPRFTDNGNGTVTDNLTGLIWLKNANCTETVGSIAKGSGYLTWPDALTWSNALAAGSCGLTDSSVAGDWRLPNITELKSLVDLSQQNPAIPSGHPFSNVQSSWYWSASTYPYGASTAWGVNMSDGIVSSGFDVKADVNYVWPVRGGN